MALETAEVAEPRLGHDILCFFDAWEDTRGFLAEIIDSCRTSKETEQLLEQSLLAGAEDWHYLIECADSIRRTRANQTRSLDGQDVLTYVWYIFDGVDLSTSARPWEETDRLIAVAKSLEREAEREISLATRPRHENGETIAPSRPTDKPNGRVTTSHYWSAEAQARRPEKSHKWTVSRYTDNLPSTGTMLTQRSLEVPRAESQIGPNPGPGIRNGHLFANATGEKDDLSSDTGIVSTMEIGANKATVSPYFTPIASEKKRPPPKRPPPGTVSTVPFPPLNSPTFGIIQEKLAHDPFWLLIAATFLIKTNGKLAIPVFYRVKERFPTPTDIADASNVGELIGMIHHLGLSVVRVAFMQKYAKGFLENPPSAGLRYRVKNYDGRDIDASINELTEEVEMSEPVSSVPSPDNREGLDSWEIGHMTKGKYAIDSWRIFCRDELLGRALDWNGNGREPEFQPEWMRVMPDDKELRAYLRWMWMREGWEWDPVTGARTVLRDEMRRAVDEGRVEYDDTGGLRILDEARVF